MADPSIVQWKTSNEVASGVLTASVTLDAAPTPGNLLLAIAQINGNNPNLITVLPTGFNTEYGGVVASSTVALKYGGKVVQAGDTAGPYTITVTGSTSRPRITILEITNQRAGNDWKNSVTLASATSFFSTASGQTTTLNIPTSGLVLAHYVTSTSGANSTVVGPSEAAWSNVVPQSSGGNTASNFQIDRALLTQADNPSGGTLTHSIRSTVAAGQYPSAGFGFLVIAGSVAPPTLGPYDPVLVQYNSSPEVASTATSNSVTLNAAPTPGNLLLAFCQHNGTTAQRASVPTGFTQELAFNNAFSNTAFVYASRIVQAGDTAGPHTYTVTTTGLRPRLTVVEVANQAAGTGWKVLAAAGTAGSAADSAPGQLNTVVVPKSALVFATLGISTSEAAAYNINAPNEPLWNTLVPIGASTIASGHQIDATYVLQATQPMGASLPHTVRIPGGFWTSYAVGFLAVKGPDTGTTTAYVDHVAAEAVSTPDVVQATLDHVLAETVTSLDPAAVESRVDHVVSEVVYSAPAEANVDAVQAEVVVPYIPPPAELHVTSVDVEVVSVYPLAANTDGANVDTVVLETVVHYPLQANSDGLNVTNITLEAVLAHGAVPILPPANPLIPMIC